MDSTALRFDRGRDVHVFLFKLRLRAAAQRPLVVPGLATRPSKTLSRHALWLEKSFSPR